MCWKKLSMAIVMAGILVVGPISPAFAQDTVESTLGGIYSTTTTGLTTAAIAGGVILTVVLASSSSQQASMEEYMRHNAVAIQHDLYLGGGATAQDMAEIFQIREGHFDAFAQILFDNRERLAPLAEPGQIDTVSAYQFVEVIVTSMMADPALAMHARSLG